MFNDHVLEEGVFLVCLVQSQTKIDQVLALFLDLTGEGVVISLMFLLKTVFSDDWRCIGRSEYYIERAGSNLIYQDNSVLSAC